MNTNDAKVEDRGPLDLGWFTWCLGVQSMPEMLDFYERLGFTVVGGDPDQGWAGLNNAGTDLSLIQGLPGPCLNFRGGDVHALVAEHRRRGFTPIRFAEYDPSVYPAEWHTDEEGRELPLAGAASYTLEDPDGNHVFFDSVPLERARYGEGQRYCQPAASGELLPEQKLLGRHELCLAVRDLSASVAFYRRVGLSPVGGNEEEHWTVMGRSEPAELRVALYQGHLERNCMNFRGADVFAVAERLQSDGIEPVRGPEVEKDGSAGAWYEDPEGNAIYLNTAPDEE